MDQPTAFLDSPSPTGSTPGVAAAPEERVADSILLQRIERVLHATGYGHLRSIGVTAHAGGVRLEGRVPSYYLKQIAQATALGVPGVQNLENDLEVVSGPNSRLDHSRTLERTSCGCHQSTGVASRGPILSSRRHADPGICESNRCAFEANLQVHDAGTMDTLTV